MESETFLKQIKHLMKKINKIDSSKEPVNIIENSSLVPQNWFGRSYTTISSSCTTAVNKISQLTTDVTVNKVSCCLILTSAVVSALYAATNPSNSLRYDISGGTAIAFSSSFAISLGTAALQYLRGNKKDAILWLFGSTLYVGFNNLSYIQQLDTAHTNKPVDSACLAFKQDELKSMSDGISSNFIDFSLFDRSRLYIDNNFDGDSPIWLGGHIPTYLPRNFSVVIKKEKSCEDSSLRAEKMKKAQIICSSNNYTHLNVPKARAYKNFNIESRLPIPISAGSEKTKRQIALYTQYPERFTKSITELTNFLCQTTLSDLIGGAVGIKNLLKNEVPRHDNAVLYLEEENNEIKGKIALVDLDGFEAKRPGYSQLQAVITLFPLHYNEIIQEAKTFFSDLQELTPSFFKRVRDDALDFINQVYLSHANFLMLNGITPENPNKFAPCSFTLERKNEIQYILSSKLIEDWKTKNQSLYSGNIAKTLNNIQKIIPELLDIVTTLFEEILKPSKEQPLNYVDLVESRTFNFNYGIIKEYVMSKNMTDKFSILKELKEQENFRDIQELGFYLIDKLFEELVRGGEIVDYERLGRISENAYSEHIVFW